MTVEERLGTLGDDEPRDQFPVGMRVLAVDDDPTCLRLLDTLLRRCQYNVTTTSQAITALKLLRENKNKFDLVISDVHMPDMDGFKLLELVGLEMDLPVIMLSANSNTNVVMKGITHGACDYLLKPVRLEELKNIWQHVVRRKKFDSKGQSNYNNQEKSHNGAGEGGQGPNATGNTDRNGKLNRKRKDQNEDEDEETEENGHENEDPSTQKKPRVVWSVELHRKFVAAVNQLGIDKAVPKRILDLMNVERLTRENVASHLQKYRLYLKRISCVASQQANMVAALAVKDPSYLRMGSLDGLGDFHALTGSAQLPSASLMLFPSGGMLNRLNTPAGLGLRGLASSGMIQLGRSQNISNSINDLGKFQQVTLSGNQSANLLHGMPTSLDLDQLQQSKGTSRIGEFGSVSDPKIFPVGNGFSDTGVTIGSSSSSFLSVQTNPLVLQGHQQQTQNRGLANQSSIQVAPLNADPFDVGTSVSSHLVDPGRCNDNWQSAAPLTGFSASPLPSSNPFNHGDLSASNLRDNISSTSSHVGNNPLDISATSVVPTPLQDSRRNVQCQSSGPSGNCAQHDNTKFSNFGGFNNSISESMTYAPKQRWEDHKQDYTDRSNLMFSSLNSSLPSHGVVNPLNQSLGQNSAVCSTDMDVILVGQSNTAAPFLMQNNDVGKSAMDATMKLNSLEQSRSQDGFVSNNCGSLEDLMSAMIKRERDEVTLMDGDIGYDVYPLGTCM